MTRADLRQRAPRFMCAPSVRTAPAPVRARLSLSSLALRVAALATLAGILSHVLQ